MLLGQPVPFPMADLHRVDSVGAATPPGSCGPRRFGGTLDGIGTGTARSASRNSSSQSSSSSACRRLRPGRAAPPVARPARSGWTSDTSTLCRLLRLRRARRCSEGVAPVPIARSGGTSGHKYGSGRDYRAGCPAPARPYGGVARLAEARGVFEILACVLDLLRSGCPHIAGGAVHSAAGSTFDLRGPWPPLMAFVSRGAIGVYVDIGQPTHARCIRLVAPDQEPGEQLCASTRVVFVSRRVRLTTRAVTSKPRGQCRRMRRHIPAVCGADVLLEDGHHADYQPCSDRNVIDRALPAGVFQA